MASVNICITDFFVVSHSALDLALQKINAVTHNCNNENEIEQLLKDSSREWYFLLDEFEGPLFDILKLKRQRILGPPIILSCANSNQPLPNCSRPLYCTLLRDVSLCFTGFKEKGTMAKLVNIAHSMGASVRKEMTARVTHLVANTVRSQKYRAAVNFDVDIMSEQWIHEFWNRKTERNLTLDDPKLMSYRLTVFHGCYIAFHGFSDPERQQMEDNTRTQGGIPTTMIDTNCTHIVVENSHAEIPEHINVKAMVVKQEWFWESIQLNACADEALYLLSNMTPSGNNSIHIHRSTLKSRKRRHSKIDLSELLTRRDSRHSLLSSILDLTASMLETSGANLDEDHGTDTSCSNIPPTIKDKHHTARKQVVIELLQTEINYVGILNTIIHLFKSPLEQDHRGGPILSPEEIKTIFSSIPQILNVHNIILESLQQMLNNWVEECLVSEIFIKNAEALLKAYPPFINFFELTKETLEQCDKKYPRFHAFLKLCQNKPECGRQSLLELLIRPVQRLPSTILLLQDIMKHTPATNPDSTELEAAIGSLKNVMAHINEDKRRTEGRMQMFEIVRDIEGCPPYLLSSHRSLVVCFDMIALSDVFCDKGDAITIFLFSDSIEISKKRMGLKTIRTSSSASNYTLPIGKTSVKTLSNNKSMYKHIEFMPLSYVKRIVDVTDTEDYIGIFAFIFRSPANVKEKLAIFRLIINEDMTKDEILRKFTRCLAENACSADSESFLTTANTHEVMISKKDLSLDSFSNHLLSGCYDDDGEDATFQVSTTPINQDRASNGGLALLN